MPDTQDFMPKPGFISLRVPIMLNPFVLRYRYTVGRQIPQFTKIIHGVLDEKHDCLTLVLASSLTAPPSISDVNCVTAHHKQLVAEKTGSVILSLM